MKSPNTILTTTILIQKNSKIHSILKDNSGNLWLAAYQKGVMQIPARTNSFKYIGHKSMDKKHNRFQLYNLILQRQQRYVMGWNRQ